MGTNSKWIRSGVSILIMVAIVAACKSTKDERTEGRALDDKHITENIQKTLKDEPTYKFKDISVNTFAGVVALGGFVNSEAEKSRAEFLARNTSGVKEVSNGIVLKPTNLQPTGPTNTQSRIYSEPQHPVLPKEGHR